MENFLIVLASLSTGVAEIVTNPSVTEVVVGGSTFLNFSNDSRQKISCFRTQFGSTHETFIYRNDAFIQPLDDRLKMERNETHRAYKLVISQARITDAGIYRCQEATGQGSNETAQLIVLDSEPVCAPKMNTHEIIGQNKCGIEANQLILSCTVTFHGNEAPIMEWRRISDNSHVIEGVTHRTIGNNRVVYNLTMNGNSTVKDGDSYFCKTTRSATSNVGCKSGKIKMAGTVNSTYVIIICTVVGLVIFLLAMILGFKLGMIRQGHRLKQKESAAAAKQHRSKGMKSEQIALTKRDTELFQTDNETLRLEYEQLRMENERLMAKVKDLEQLRYNTDNIRGRTPINLVHTIQTRATENGPITGMAILENNLYVVRKKCQNIEFYDSRTFVFGGLIKNQPLTNPLDIAASKEDKRLYMYIFNRRDQFSSVIVKVNIAGEGGKVWVTENDDGRISTFESNLIVCLLAKRIVIEYSPEGKTLNTVRLSPGNGFNQIWHAVKLTGIHFAVSHSKTEGGQRVCVVDINGNILAHYEEYSNLVTEAFLPLCLVEDGEESLFVADARHNKVLLLNSRLKHEGVLINTDRNRIPVRICLTEARDRIFVAVNSGECAKQEKWTDGRILIYNITKMK